MRLGTLVTGVTYRNPALLAKIVTTLDVISGGPGHARDRRGLVRARARRPRRSSSRGFSERIDRLEEALQICRAMFRDERPTFNGRYYAVHEAINQPAPVRRGGPPIMIGGAASGGRCGWWRSTPTSAT